MFDTIDFVDVEATLSNSEIEEMTAFPEPHEGYFDDLAAFEGFHA